MTTVTTDTRERTVLLKTHKRSWQSQAKQAPRTEGALPPPPAVLNGQLQAQLRAQLQEQLRTNRTSGAPRSCWVHTGTGVTPGHQARGLCFHVKSDMLHWNVCNYSAISSTCKHALCFTLNMFLYSDQLPHPSRVASPGKQAICCQVLFLFVF